MPDKKMKPDSCSLCGNTKYVIEGHHLSYTPEVVVFLCRMCHMTLHNMQQCKEQLPQFIKWIEEYGHLWENGRIKYRKTEYCKNRIKTWEKNNPKYMERRKSYLRKYNKEYYQKDKDRGKERAKLSYERKKIRAKSQDSLFSHK